MNNGENAKPDSLGKSFYLAHRLEDEEKPWKSCDVLVEFHVYSGNRRGVAGDYGAITRFEDGVIVNVTGMKIPALRGEWRAHRAAGYTRK